MSEVLIDAVTGFNKAWSCFKPAKDGLLTLLAIEESDFCKVDRVEVVTYDWLEGMSGLVVNEQVVGGFHLIVLKFGGCCYDTIDVYIVPLEGIGYISAYNLLEYDLEEEDV